MTSLSYAAYATEEFAPTKKEIEQLIEAGKYDEAQQKCSELTTKEISKYEEGFIDIELFKISMNIVFGEVNQLINQTLTNINNEIPNVSEDEIIVVNIKS